MQKRYTMTAAAALLGVDIATLRRWCARAGVDSAPGEQNKRARFLTWEQLARLATEQGRDLPAALAPDQGQELPALLEEVLQRLEALEQWRADQERQARPSVLPDRSALPAAPSIGAQGDAVDAPRVGAPVAPLQSWTYQGPSQSYPRPRPVDRAPGLPAPVRALVAEWLEQHGGPHKNTARRWEDMPLEPRAALLYTLDKIAQEPGRLAYAQMRPCGNLHCPCQELLT